ncbi:DedA family protein [Haloarchaeobius sp. DFWS5]|uniref:DedA family protein n=1 Tax=Haloarchaeobius sp. DFWS5 TaxID=3446114 RepID=UPI003EBFDF0A
MVELAWLTDATITFIQRYGYIALFIFLILETSFILHFIPSEVVIPLAVYAMVTSPTGFVVFVVVSTVAGVLGSILCYWLFGVNGERIIQRWGHILHIPEEEIERSKDWFHRYGEGLMFWGRFLPVLRTPISIPAGFAEMDLKKFSLYSGAGWGIYVAMLGALAYRDGTESQAPIEVAIAAVWPLVETYPILTAVLVALVSAGSVVAWKRRSAIAR